VRKLDTLPGAVVVVDTNYEHIAVHEARILGIPIVGMVDTNCNPDSVDYVIPSNDDAIRAIDLIIGILAQAAIDGRQTLTEGYNVEINDKPAEESHEVKEEVEEVVVEKEEDIDIEAAVTEEYLPDEVDMENK
jgi:small subunit ribosomal protein S2